MQQRLSISGFTLSALIAASTCLTSCTPEADSTEPETILVSEEALVEIEPAAATDDFGFLVGSYEVESDRIQRNESLYVILRRHGVTPLQIDHIQKAASEHANLRSLRPGQNYHIYQKSGEAVALVWNINRRDYLVINWEQDEVDVYRGQFEVRTVERSVAGIIESSLYLTLQEEGFPQTLGAGIANIFAWEIDFFSLRSGDSFKALYDELYIGDEFYGIGRIHSAEFNHRGETKRAYYFESEEQDGYFDEEGNSLHKAMLMAPFNYDQRVSSSFSHSRLHPILRERRPHYGTDYAAPRGTPVIAVGDGTVTEAQRRGGNGNIVQIRHNSTYRSAYLHLDRFAKGVRPGVRVSQGQVIGYVGMTGLATGYHLCYRLYVNDQPVNSRAIDLPASESLRPEFMAEFTRLRLEQDRELARLQPQQGREDGEQLSSL